MLFFLILLVSFLLSSKNVLDILNVTTICHGSYCFPRVVWGFWSDENKIPEDISQILNVTKCSLKNFTFGLLTDKNASKLINMRLFPERLSKLGNTIKADFVKYSLLEEYGGVFIDSTTFVNSGSGMEWFFYEALKEKCQVVSFDNKPWIISGPFSGACSNSPLSKKIKHDFNIFLKRGGNHAKRAKRLCEEVKKNGGIRIPCNFREYTAAIVAKVILDNPDLESKILYLPRSKSNEAIYDGLTKVCKRDPRYTRAILSCDAHARTEPFIKIFHRERNGKKFDIVGDISKTCTKALRKVWEVCRIKKGMLGKSFQ